MLAQTWLTLLVWFPQAEKPVARETVPAEEVRRIVKHVVLAAEENAARKFGKLQGDALMDFYVRRAAAVVETEQLSPRAFLVAIGLALDPTSLLRDNPVSRPYLTQLETSEERGRRLRSLGEPTLRGRRDWVLHFAISAALAAMTGPEMAEHVGVLKEVMDAQPGGSGFSFGDLAADYAGVAFALPLLGDAAKAKERLRELAQGFEGAKHLPDIKDLEEDIRWDRFVNDYGGIGDARFQKLAASIRQRIYRHVGLPLEKPAKPS